MDNEKLDHYIEGESVMLKNGDRVKVEFEGVLVHENSGGEWDVNISTQMFDVEYIPVGAITKIDRKVAIELTETQLRDLSCLDLTLPQKAPGVLEIVDNALNVLDT